MGLFGQNNLQTLGATLQDAGAGLRGGQGQALMMLDARRRKEAQQAQMEAAQAELQQAIQSAYATKPGVPGKGMIGPGMDGEPTGQAAQPPQPPVNPMQAIIPALLRARSQGIDVDGIDDILKMGQPKRQLINAGNGAYGVWNESDNSMQTGQIPGQYDDVKGDQIGAQVEAAKALKAQREAQTAMILKKTANPALFRAPPRGSTAKTLPPLKPGFRIEG